MEPNLPAKLDNRGIRSLASCRRLVLAASAIIQSHSTYLPNKATRQQSSHSTPPLTLFIKRTFHPSAVHLLKNPLSGIRHLIFKLPLWPVLSTSIHRKRKRHPRHQQVFECPFSQTSPDAGISSRLPGMCLALRWGSRSSNGLPARSFVRKWAFPLKRSTTC